MEVYPKDQQTELTSFRSYENFKTYSWGLYNVFSAMHIKQDKLMKSLKEIMKLTI